jgi:hypothetical protein
MTIDDEPPAIMERQCHPVSSGCGVRIRQSRAGFFRGRLNSVCAGNHGNQGQKLPYLAKILIKQAAHYFRLDEADLTRKGGRHRQECNSRPTRSAIAKQALRGARLRRESTPAR